jgi:hypothetical protein
MYASGRLQEGEVVEVLHTGMGSELAKARVEELRRDAARAAAKRRHKQVTRTEGRRARVGLGPVLEGPLLGQEAR